jgi:hypothetical protein
MWTTLLCSYSFNRQLLFSFHSYSWCKSRISTGWMMEWCSFKETEPLSVHSQHCRLNTDHDAGLRARTSPEFDKQHSRLCYLSSSSTYSKIYPDYLGRYRVPRLISHNERGDFTLAIWAECRSPNLQHWTLVAILEIFLSQSSLCAAICNVFVFDLLNLV